MGNKIQVNASAANQDRPVSRGRISAITLQSLVSWIATLELDDYTKSGLISLASKYPTTALVSFKKNINVMLARVRAEQLKEREKSNESFEESIEVSEKIEPTIEKKVDNSEKPKSSRREAISSDELFGGD